ncbi:MAG: hypothetical protein WCF33_25270 [Pseudonocardiaceae bacterium]
MLVCEQRDADQTWSGLVAVVAGLPVRVVWEVISAGQCLRVAGPAELSWWWPRIGPQVPGVAAGPLVSVAGHPQVRLPENVTAADARRWINAHLHCVHLRCETLSVHGVAVAREGRAVVLLGGHGAGKSLTGLALMTGHAWRSVAGDTVLIQVRERAAPMVIGGTSAYLVRRRETHRWFPELPLPMGSGDRVDISHQPALGDHPGFPLVGVIQVAVDAGRSGTGSVTRCEEHIARNAWYRASGHLLDKVLDDHHADPLRLVEDKELARRRARLVRFLAASTGCGWICGDPHRMAAAISRVSGREAAR